MSVFQRLGNNCLGSPSCHRHLPWNIATKLLGLLNICSLEIMQSRLLKKLTTPSLLVILPTHPSSSINTCRILVTISPSQRSVCGRNGFASTFAKQCSPLKCLHRCWNQFARKGLQDVKSYGRVSVATGFLR